MSAGLGDVARKEMMMIRKASRRRRKPEEEEEEEDEHQNTLGAFLEKPRRRSDGRRGNKRIVCARHEMKDEG